MMDLKLLMMVNIKKVKKLVNGTSYIREEKCKEIINIKWWRIL